MKTAKMVTAEVPDRGRMFYLVDENLDFIPEVKDFLDWKAATRRAPSTIEAYCFRLCWYYRFLCQHHLDVGSVTPADLTEFVIWLCHPYRDVQTSGVDSPSAYPIGITTVNLILQAVGALYGFLVRRGTLTTSPVVYVEVPKSQWLIEADLLVHTHRGRQTVLRQELKLKEPKRELTALSEQDFQTFLNAIHIGESPAADPAGFRDRLICLMLKEAGFRIGELLGIHVEDIDFGKGGVHIRFRPDNENLARAKAGYGRDRFVNLPAHVLGLLDIYLTEVWVEAHPHTEHLWLVLNKHARNQDGQGTCGTALPISALEKMFQYYSKKSGVMLHPHTLRHTHATELVQSFLRDDLTVDWKFIQERLGHASVVTTMQIYAHLTDEDRKRAYESYTKRKEAARAEKKQSSTRSDI